MELGKCLIIKNFLLILIQMLEVLQAWNYNPQKFWASVLTNFYFQVHRYLEKDARMPVTNVDVFTRQNQVCLDTLKSSAEKKSRSSVSFACIRFTTNLS